MKLTIIRFVIPMTRRITEKNNPARLRSRRILTDLLKLAFFILNRRVDANNKADVMTSVITKMKSRIDTGIRKESTSANNFISLID